MQDRVAATGSEAWLGRLRERFLAVSRKRVPEEVAEDIVQEALVVVYEKGIAGQRSDDFDDLPALAWCFQVLRNRIGNYYQRERVRAHATLDEIDKEGRPPESADRSARTPLESFEAREESRIIGEALEALAAEDGKCGRYMLWLLHGMKPAQLAAEEKLSEPILYRRVYRCRGKLRAILEKRGFEL